MTRFNVDPISQALPQSNTIYVRVLVANLAEDVDVPEYARYVVFSATTDFWMRIDAEAAIAVPTTDNSDGDAPELNPLVRMIGEGHTISLISATACTISLAFYS
jgi:hypothetical protein